MSYEFKLYFDVLRYNLIEIIYPQQLKPIERKTTDTNMGKALAGIFGIVFVSLIGFIVKHFLKNRNQRKWGNAWKKRKVNHEYLQR